LQKVLLYKSLRQGRKARTPAMAIGLTVYVWSYREYIWLPMHVAPVLTQQMNERVAQLLIPALQDQPSSSKQAKAPPAESREVQEEEEHMMPQAA
jgi:hypothetical protein